MNNFFAAIYENFIYNETYHAIFQYLFDSGSYAWFGLAVVAIPILFWAAFYFIWMYPYGRGWHWLIWMAITLVVVFLSGLGIASLVILASSDPIMIDCFNDANCNTYAHSLPIQYAFLNVIIAFVWGLIISFAFKQFSKVQAHLPR